MKRFIPAILALATTACVGDGYIKVQGVITTSTGEPIAGAEISIQHGPGLTHTVTTDHTGCFKLGITAAPYRSKYYLLSSHQGFQPVSFTAHSAEVTRVVIVLASESARDTGHVSVQTVAPLGAPDQPCPFSSGTPGPTIPR